MKTASLITLVFVFLFGHVVGQDRFNYIATNWEDRTFGPSDWGEVECDNVNVCVRSILLNDFLFARMPFLTRRYFLHHPRIQPGWPTNWDVLGDFIDLENRQNNCIDCSESVRDECRRHKQSPINVFREITSRRKCRDWHRMHFNKGNCIFDEMRFEILPHVLRAYQPRNGCNVDPCIDFSHGFP